MIDLMLGFGTEHNPMVWGERHIILVAQGEYKFDSILRETETLDSCIIVGELSGSKPIFLLVFVYQ